MPGAEVWGAFSADPRDPSVTDLRASDADRDRAGDVVRDAFVDGRLTREEFDVRRDAVLQARTLGSILPLIRDLVPLSSPPAPHAPSMSPATTTVPVVRGGEESSDLAADAQRQYARDLRDARNGWVLVTTLCVGIWGATSLAGGAYFFWPVFPSLGVGVGYLMLRLDRDRHVEQIEEKLVTKRQARALRERRRREY